MLASAAEPYDIEVERDLVSFLWLTTLKENLPELKIVKLLDLLDVQYQDVESRLPSSATDPSYDAAKHLLNNIKATTARIQKVVEEFEEIFEIIDRGLKRR